MPVIRHFHQLSPKDAAHVEMVRQTIREALEVLKLPQPDTFLGRQTYEPFPKEDPES
ncbi:MULTISPECIES: hypothetical protein [Bradyrhizobium]|uniref:hypothetical protein n=1 Tax=Bradyrhizobium TaxID=374 RepID=UPI000419C0C3|nr:MULTISPECIES: hypothetical protein [Bradyrhizobium]UFW48550.1 hypothetical protein BaraCB756_40945 [Bradyrhizobium arachidis]